MIDSFALNTLCVNQFINHIVKNLLICWLTINENLQQGDWDGEKAIGGGETEIGGGKGKIFEDFQ